MKATEFAYWLQGFFELSEASTLSARQVEVIKAHLDMVFIHDIDPSYPPEQQDALNKAHTGPAIPGAKKPLKSDPSKTMMRC